MTLLRTHPDPSPALSRLRRAPEVGAEVPEPAEMFGTPPPGGPSEPPPGGLSELPPVEALGEQRGEPEWMRQRALDEAASDAVPRWSRWFALPRDWLDARVDPGRAGALVLVACAVLAAAVTYLFVWRDPPSVVPEPAIAASASDLQPSTSVASSAEGEPIVVAAAGLVHRPGLVTLPAGSRVADVLAAAGGALPEADLLGVNLAARVGDGEQVVVPGPGVSAAGGAGAGGTTAGKVNLNTATAADLEALPGVGPVTAAAIVARRSASGRFTAVEQLGEVDGIGPSKLAKLRDLVTV